MPQIEKEEKALKYKRLRVYNSQGAVDSFALLSASERKEVLMILQVAGFAKSTAYRYLTQPVAIDAATKNTINQAFGKEVIQ